MKKKFFFAAVALVALASCADKEYVGDSPTPNPENGTSDAIVFNSGAKTATRADYYGQAAADKLNNKFIVGGFKGALGTSTVYTDGEITTYGVPAINKVFDNYVVTYTPNTAGTTESNSSDWEYVGTTVALPSTLAEGTIQSIKYWDYSTDQYDFIAYSTGDAAVVTGTTAPGTGQVHVTAIDAANAGKLASGGAYSLKGDKDGLKKCYIADMVTIYKDGSDDTKYRDVVKFTFRSLISKVRVALYETIPGYAVKDVKFYTNATANLNSEVATDKVNNATLFATGTTDKDNFYTSGEYKVYFPTIGKSNATPTKNSDYNKAHVAFTADASGKGTTMDFGALVYNAAPRHKEGDGDSRWLARNSANATFAGTADPYYQIALPNEEGTILELRVDYTLYSEDGSGETIKVYGATAYVPAIYAAWKPNYAYTYIFKISDNTNGWTHAVADDENTVDPAGLYPITFDAIVMETEDYNQTTITNVSSPSITTYQKGHIYTQGTTEANGSKEYYNAIGDIYVQVISDGTLKSDLGSKGQLYTVTGGPSGATATEAVVLDALNLQASSTETTITGRNSWVLTKASSDATIKAVPGADGNNIVVTAGEAAKFTPTASTTYAYVYDTDTYGGDFYPTAPAGWPTGYFTNAACTTAATGTFPAAGGMYYRTSSDIVSTYVLSSAPSDWNAEANIYYSDAACTSPINSAYANPSASYTSQPTDWPTGYFTDATCTTAATTFTASTTYYKKLVCYKKYTVNNKIYGVKIIKVL